MILNPSKGYAKVCLSLLIASALALSACAEQEKTKTQFEEQQGKAEKAMEQLKPSAPIAQPLMIDKRPYYGSAAVPLSNGSARLRNLNRTTPW
jgi:uncharacterized lipoprotein